jgi:hypothetical protein
MENNQSSQQSSQSTQNESQQIYSANLPLAVYRELAAHLRQVTGVEAELLPQIAQTFDYHQSQAGGIKLSYSPEVDAAARQHVQQILAYYSQRYGDAQNRTF